MWTEQSGELDRLVEAGLIACWPDDDHADPAAVIETTVSEITRMSEGIHGRLKNTAERLLDRLTTLEDPNRLVDRVRHHAVLPAPAKGDPR